MENHQTIVKASTKMLKTYEKQWRSQRITIDAIRKIETMEQNMGNHTKSQKKEEGIPTNLRKTTNIAKIMQEFRNGSGAVGPER